MAAPKFIQRVNGYLTSVAAAVVGGASSANQLVATNASGVIDASFMPAGVGQDIIVVPASEAIASGGIVNLWNNSSACNARNADSATAACGKKASGFVLAAVAANASASVYRSGQNTGLTGLTPGGDVWLGASGAVTQTVPAETSGTTAQLLGTAVSATNADIQPGVPVGIQ